MALTGDLGSIDLANVFQMLLLSQKTGTLAIRARGGRSEVYFDAESVLVPFDKDAFPTKVVKSLERSGKLSPEQVARAQASFGVVQSDLFTILLQMRALTSEEISSAWRTQMEEEIYELFVDREATFEFHEGQPPSLPGKAIDARYRLVGNSLLMEAARRLDEWGFIRERVPSDRCILEMPGGAPPLPDSERDGPMEAVIAGIDGRSPVTAIVAATGLTRFVVSKKLALLVEVHAAYEVPREALIERARACLREQKGEAGLALLERALELGSEDPAAHEMAALAHQSLGRVGEACRHLAKVADALERAGQRRPAAEVHLRIRDLLPTDVHCRERLVHHWLDDADFFKTARYAAEDEALELVAILRELSRHDSARELVSELAEPFRKDVRLSTKLADLAIELGDAKLAVQVLLGSADYLLDLKQPAAASRLYRRIRTIDPQHEGLESKLKKCERHVSSLQRPSVMRWVAAAVFVIGAALGLLAYNREALAAWAKLPVEELVVAGDFAGALKELDSLRTEYPASVALVLAAESARSVAARRDRATAAVEQRQEALARESQRRQKAAERAYAEALERLDRGERDAAITGFEKAAEQGNDPQFLAEKRPAEKARELREERDLEQRDFAAYEAALAAREWERMRALALDLTARRGPRSSEPPLLIPVRIVVDPADAELALEPAPADGKALASPAIVLLPAGSRAKLRARRSGRFAVEQEIAPEKKYELVVRLDRSPEKSLDLPRRTRFAPLVDGAVVFLACEEGCVVALDANKLEPKWERKLSDLDDTAGPPVLERRGLRVATRKGRHAWFNPYTGDPLGIEEGAATAVAPLPVATGAGDVTLPDGRRLRVDGAMVVLDDAEGATLASWRAPGRPDWSGAVPGGALFGGPGWIVRIVPDLAIHEKSAGGDGR